jgi:hypothetical protein
MNSDFRPTPFEDFLRQFGVLHEDEIPDAADFIWKCFQGCDQLLKSYLTIAG